MHSKMANGSMATGWDHAAIETLQPVSHVLFIDQRCQMTPLQLVFTISLGPEMSAMTWSNGMLKSRYIQNRGCPFAVTIFRPGRLAEPHAAEGNTVGIGGPFQCLANGAPLRFHQPCFIVGGVPDSSTGSRPGQACK